MAEHNLYQIFTSRLNRLSIPYIVTDALDHLKAGQHHPVNILELVAALSLGKVEAFCKTFPDSQFYCPPRAVIRVEINRSEGGRFNLVHHASSYVAVVCLSGQDELNFWGLKNRKRLSLDGYELWLAPFEYDILRKLEYYRQGKSEKHLREISDLLNFASDQIDFSALKERIDHMRLGEAWALAEKFRDDC